MWLTRVMVMLEQHALLVKEIAQSRKEGSAWYLVVGVLRGIVCSSFLSTCLPTCVPHVGVQGRSYWEWQEKAVCKPPGRVSFY